MSDLGDLIKGAGDAHADALEAWRREAAGPMDGALASAAGDESTARAVASVRRRRLFRAGATGAVAAIGVGVLAVTAVAALGPDEQQPVAPTVTGSEPWCDLDSYPLPNVDAKSIPAAYYGRVYADFTTDTYMLRTVDGDLRQLELNEDNVWADPMTALPYDLLDDIRVSARESGVDLSRLVFDRYSGGTFGEVAATDLGYEWGTPVESAVPEGIWEPLLSAAHEEVRTDYGGGLTVGLAGKDAVVERILTYADGTTQTTRVLIGQVAPELEPADDLVSLTTRVTTASGETAGITSSYDASLTYEAACGTSDSAWASSEETHLSSPDDLVPVTEDPGNYLAGPESAVFSCGSALDPAIEEQAVWSERRVGVVYVEDEGQQVDYGRGATIVGTDLTHEDMDGFEMIEGMSSPGWETASSVDETTGIHVFATVAWVDNDDRIVATLDRSELTYRGDPWFTSGLRYESVNDDVGSLYFTLLDEVRAYRAICAGDELREDLGSLTPVLLTGHGPSAASMDWAWYRFDG